MNLLMELIPYESGVPLAMILGAVSRFHCLYQYIYHWNWSSNESGIPWQQFLMSCIYVFCIILIYICGLVLVLGYQLVLIFHVVLIFTCLSACQKISMYIRLVSCMHYTYPLYLYVWWYSTKWIANEIIAIHPIFCLWMKFHLNRGERLNQWPARPSPQPILCWWSAPSPSHCRRRTVFFSPSIEYNKDTVCRVGL